MRARCGGECRRVGGQSQVRGWWVLLRRMGSTVWRPRFCFLIYPQVRERNGGWRGYGCIWLVAIGEWGLETAERDGDEFGKWCQAASAVVVQRVLGEEEEVGVIAECCDSRLHSLHRLSV